MAGLPAGSSYSHVALLQRFGFKTTDGSNGVDKLNIPNKGSRQILRPDGTLIASNFNKFYTILDDGSLLNTPGGRGREHRLIPLSIGVD